MPIERLSRLLGLPEGVYVTGIAFDEYSSNDRFTLEHRDEKHSVVHVRISSERFETVEEGVCLPDMKIIDAFVNDPNLAVVNDPSLTGTI